MFANKNLPIIGDWYYFVNTYTSNNQKTYLTNYFIAKLYDIKYLHDKPYYIAAGVSDDNWYRYLHPFDGTVLTRSELCELTGLPDYER